MTTTKLIFHNMGENQHSYPSVEVSPVAIFDHIEEDHFIGLRQHYEEEFKVNYPIQDTRCFSSDDDGLVKCIVSWVVDYDLHGLEPNLFLSYDYFFQRVFQYNQKIDFTIWSKNMLINLLKLRSQSIDYALKIVKLLGYTGKSSFQTSLRDQCLSWLSMNPEDQRYNKPLSDKQYYSLTKWDR